MNEREITNKILKEATYYQQGYYVFRTADIPTGYQNTHGCDFMICHRGRIYFVEVKKASSKKTLRSLLTDSQKKSFPRILQAEGVLFLVIVDEEKDICRIIRLKKYNEDIRVDGDVGNDDISELIDFRANYIWQSLIWFIQEIEKGE